MEPTGSSRNDPCSSSKGPIDGTDKQRPNPSSISDDAQGPQLGSGSLGLDSYGVDAGSVFPTALSYPEEWQWPLPHPLEIPEQQLNQLPPMAVCKGDPSAKLYREGCSSTRCQVLSAGDDDELLEDEELPVDNELHLPPAVHSVVQAVLGQQTEYDREFPSKDQLEIHEKRKKAHLPQFREVKISKYGFPKLGRPTTKGSDKMWVGINGFGQIGRLVARLMLRRHSKQMELVAINDPTVSAEEMEKFMIAIPPADFRDVKVFHLNDPKDIPWGGIGVDCVVESTGLFTDSDAGAAHLKRGAKKVVICALSKDAPVFVYGANQDKYTADVAIVSIADCATSCIAPLAKIIDDMFGIAEGLLTIRQPLPANLENANGPWCSEWREVNMALDSVLPDLAGKFSGEVCHVCDMELSSVEMILKLLDDSADYERVKSVVRDEVCKRKLLHIVAYMDGVTQLTGYGQDLRSCLFDVDAGGTLGNNTIKIIARFNNDYGYCMRCVDLILHMAKVH